MCVQTVGNGEVELGKEFHNISRLMATPFFSKTHTHTFCSNAGFGKSDRGFWGRAL